MKTLFSQILIGSLVIAFLFASACSERDKDVINPISVENFPKIILLDDGGDGDVEDGDEVEIAVTFADEIDPEGEELAGKVIPLTAPATLSFEIEAADGLANLSDYILGAKAYYEIDDCTESDDIAVTLDLAAGTGSVVFPADVEELIIALELDDALFDDDEQNSADRGFSLKLTGVDAGDQNVVVDVDNSFDYLVLDEESVFGEWELDHEDADQFAAFKALFGALDPSIQNLAVADVDAIEFEFGWEKFACKVVLVEEEEDECEPGAFDNAELEVEGEWVNDIEDLFGAESADIEFEDKIEQEDGSEVDFKFEGSFTFNGDDEITLTLSGEYLDDISEQTLTLTR